eukprot:1159753-Pelagomonas_calceolata.AAC.6
MQVISCIAGMPMCTHLAAINVQQHKAWRHTVLHAAVCTCCRAQGDLQPVLRLQNLRASIHQQSTRNWASVKHQLSRNFMPLIHAAYQHPSTTR